MKARPILFSGDMVRAILDGRKTQTRRLVSKQKYPYGTWATPEEVAAEFVHDTRAFMPPLGTIGHRLWVRETWAAVDWCDDSKPSDFGSAVWYLADNSGPHAAAAIPYKTDKRGKWRPSIHMPRWASRIDLEITAVRVERVQEITEEDAKKEGLERITFLGDTFWKLAAPIRRQEGGETIGTLDAKIAFQNLWQSIYANWDANPWVWVYEFRRIKP